MTAQQPSLALAAPAKLNLFLHVIGRRADGYHLLQSVFQLIELSDSLRFTLRDDGQVLLHTDSAHLAGVSSQNNLIIRAALALRHQTAINTRLGTDIWLEKRIPLGGGLGGGSSDAATTLLALNHLWRLDLPLTQLASIGLQLGADVPFFLLGANAWAEGVGEELTPIQLPQRWFTVIHPGVSVATPDVFRHPDLTRNTAPAKIASFAEKTQKDVFFGRNDLQAVAVKIAPQVGQALQCLAGCGARENRRESITARMTGSGACVFAVLPSEQQALALAQQVRQSSQWQDNWQVWVAKGLDRHPVHAQLGLEKQQAQ